jgi:hypothetical protein
MEATGGTNIEDGLKTANTMLQSSNAKKKIIVLMSDGEANEGRTGQDLIDYATKLREQGIYIYTLGFFNSLSDSEKIDAQKVMEGIASEGCHYEVDDAENLVFFFDDIANQINGTKYIYVKIACPVDVKVEYDGETLSSSSGNTRTSFGSLTYEENNGEDTEESDEDTDDTTKILRLKEGVDYDISIDGNGKGKMNYSIGFMDDNGEYTDFREFKNIAITKSTKVDTVAKVSDETVLKVDEDGDGKYDLTYKAQANGKGELVDNSFALYVVLGVTVAFVVIVLAIDIKVKVKRKRKSKQLQTQ